MVGRASSIDPCSAYHRREAKRKRRKKKERKEEEDEEEGEDIQHSCTHGRSAAREQESLWDSLVLWS